jgi:hypothetical protein
VTRRRAGLAAGALVAAGLLAGCSGGDDEAPAPSTSPAPSSLRTPPPISPRTTVTLSPETSVPQPLSPSVTDFPVPIPSAPQN